MQFLWVYIDDIIGKGAGILMLTELISYLSISLFPMALPIAVLISSVMVMGNLAERYELASFKSAGVPLLRIMMPIAFVAAVIAAFSFFCANNLIPITNLQFKSRLYDIRKSKPTLSLEEGVFNDDFQGFTIYLKEKSENGRDIKDVLIYDQGATDGKINQISAQRGEMYTTEDQRFFIMNLFDGTQSQEIAKRTEKGKRNYAFVRTNFKEYKKVFDLREFEMKDTNQDLFKNHQTMLNVGQLQTAVDSIDVKIKKREQKLEKHLIQFLFFEKQRDTILFKKRKPKLLDKKQETKVDSLQEKPSLDGKAKPKIIEKPVHINKKPTKKKQKAFQRNSNATNKRPTKPKPKPSKKRYKNRNVLSQKIDKDLSEYASFIDLFETQHQKQIVQKATTTARSVKSQATGTVTSLHRERKLRVKHVYEMHLKFAMAMVCLIFLFIGAPMGAMMQKGGFGYPILISVLFFTLFIMLTIACEKLAESLVISAELGAWLPCLILAPLGMFLTYKAMLDTKIVNLSRFITFFKTIFRFLGA